MVRIWSKSLFPDNSISIDYLHKKIVDIENYTSETVPVFYKFDGKKLVINCIDLVPFEIDKLVQDINNLTESDISKIKSVEYIEQAENNIRYRKDNTDEIALNYYKMALDLCPTDTQLRKKYESLDKFVNHKNYTYPPNDYHTLVMLNKIFVDSCNVQEFDRLYDIIADDFVCITRSLGRTKESFIDSIDSERISFMGLRTELCQYSQNNEQIPCISINNYGVLFFNIENNKIIRAYEYKIKTELDSSKLTKFRE